MTRVLDVALGLQNKFIAGKIDDVVSIFLDVDCNQKYFCWRENIRIRILIDMSKSLKKRILIQSKDYPLRCWRPFCYERLPKFYFPCGHWPYGKGVLK